MAEQGQNRGTVLLQNRGTVLLSHFKKVDKRTVPLFFRDKRTVPLFRDKRTVPLFPMFLTYLSR